MTGSGDRRARSARPLRPTHVLVNFLASMTGLHSEVDIQRALAEIADDLATDLAEFREPAARRELVDDFQEWTQRNLLAQVGADPPSWMVSPAMALNFQAIAEGFNRDLDPDEVNRVKSAIRSVDRRHSVAH